MYKAPGYWHHTSTQIECDAAKHKLRTTPNPYPLGEFKKAVSDYLNNLIWFYVEDTGNLPTPTEYLEMCKSAIENAALPPRSAQ